jgi:exopolysaccharide production protein ExoQ
MLSDAPVILPAIDAPDVPRHTRVYTLLLFGMVLFWSRAWYHGDANVEDFVTAGAKAGATAFQYPLWALTSALVAMHLRRYGLTPLVRSAGPFLAFFGFGVLSSLRSITPSDSIRHHIFWLVAALTAASTTWALEEARVVRVIAAFFAVAMVASVAVSVLAPDVGLSRMNGNVVGWRGVFDDKNTLGWVAAWSVLFALAGRSVLPLAGSALIVAAAGSCLVASNAKGALVCSVSVGLYLLAVRTLRKAPFSPGLRMLALLSLTALGAVVVQVGSELVLALLERDPSLTGRSDIWAAYLRYVDDRWLLGYGAGSATARSSITEEVFYRFLDFGFIRTPHSMYIASLIEGGVVGAVALVIPLLIAAFSLPFTGSGLAGLLGGGAAFLMLVGGLAETHEVYNGGIGWLMLLTMRGASVKALEDEPNHSVDASLDAQAEEA